MASVIGLDTPVFVYFLENHTEYADAARETFAGILAGKHTSVASTILLTELLTGFRKRHNQLGADAALTFIRNMKNLKIMPVTWEIADRAADLRVRYHLRTADAIHVATALESDAKQFITADRTLKRIQEIEIVVLARRGSS